MTKNIFYSDNYLMNRFFACLLCLSCLSCSLDYGLSMDANDRAPSVVFYSADLSRFEQGKKSVELKADVLEQYTSEELWVGEGISFKTFDKKVDGESLSAFGDAKVLWADLKAKDYRMLNGMQLNLLKNDLIFSSKNLRINEKTNQVLGSTGEKVYISQEDGTVISGYGFAADIRTAEYSFSNSVEGTFGNGESSKENTEEPSSLDDSSELSSSEENANSSTEI